MVIVCKTLHPDNHNVEVNVIVSRRFLILKLLDIIMAEDTELEAITKVLVEVGFDEYFLLEHLSSIEYGYLNEYKDYLNRIIGDSDDEISEATLDEINLVKSTISKIKNLASNILSKEMNYKLKCVDIAEARQSFVMSKRLLSELNNIIPVFLW